MQFLQDCLRSSQLPPKEGSQFGRGGKGQPARAALSYWCVPTGDTVRLSQHWKMLQLVAQAGRAYFLSLDRTHRFAQRHGWRHTPASQTVSRAGIFQATSRIAQFDLRKRQQGIGQGMKCR